MPPITTTSNAGTGPGSIFWPINDYSLPGSAHDRTPAYGGIPNVPNPTASASHALSGNIGNLGLIYGLGQGLNRFNQQQLTNQYQAAIPNYNALTEKQSGNIAEELSGDVPQDVVNQIIQQAAERGIVTGSPGSPNAGAAMLRSLGLTSLDMQHHGVSDLATAIGEAPKAGIIDPTQFLVTPGQQQEASAAANLYASAPNPQAAAQEAQRIAAAGFGAGWGGGPRSPGGAIQPAPTSPWDTGFSTLVSGDAYVGMGDPAPGSFGDFPIPEWAWNDTLGAYYNQNSGAIADTPGGDPWEGFNYFDPTMTGAGAQ